jgi:type III pantothenate kinase
MQHRPADKSRTLLSGDVPIEIDVEFPDRVGIDRLCTALAGRRSIDNEREEGPGAPPPLPLIVIDAGTAITVDAVSAEGVFLGGAILPGMRLAAQSLADGTDALPLTTIEENAPAALGRSTESAIQAGLYWGAVGGVDAIVRQIGDSLEGEHELLATGGNGELFASKLERPVQYLSHLTLSGIMLASTTVF